MPGTPCPADVDAPVCWEPLGMHVLTGLPRRDGHAPHPPRAWPQLPWPGVGSTGVRGTV